MPGTWNNIWVISDTHLKSGKFLPDSFTNRVGREDLIIHLGDFTSLSVVESLECISSVEGVYGNCDPPEIRTIFPYRKILEIDGRNIGMMHGHGDSSSTTSRIRHEFEGKVDIAVFGHSHKAAIFRHDSTLFVNPGSLTQGRGNGVGYARISLDGKPSAEIIRL